MAGAELAQGKQALGLPYRNHPTNPLRMGAITPSPAALRRMIAARIRGETEEAVLELRAGTGAVTRALLAAGVPSERPFVVESETRMARHLAGILPPGHALRGDAFGMDRLLPRAWHGRIGTVICGIPMAMPPPDQRQRLVDGMNAAAPGRGFLLYTFGVTLSLPWQRLGLSARREGRTFRNFLPASVWRYAPAHRTDLSPSCGPGACQGNGSRRPAGSFASLRRQRLGPINHIGPSPRPGQPTKSLGNPLAPGSLTGPGLT